jgi:hypothetical protein
MCQIEEESSMLMSSSSVKCLDGVGKKVMVGVGQGTERG